MVFLVKSTMFCDYLHWLTTQTATHKNKRSVQLSYAKRAGGKNTDRWHVGVNVENLVKSILECCKIILDTGCKN